MHEVIEPPGVRRATRAMFLLFAATGVFATVGILSSGEGVFAVLFGGMFVGIPWIIHRTSIGPGVPGFTLSSDGILGAADDELRLIPWGDVGQLTWRGTGLEVNGQPCLALHAELVDGRSVRITTYTARRGREVDEIVEQVQASGMLPSGVGFGPGSRPRGRGQRAVSDRTISDRPVSDVVASETTGQPSVRSWSNLPPAVRVLLVVFLLAFLAPFLVFRAFIPLLLVAFGGVLGWLATAVLIASTAVAIVGTVRRRRTPVLACSFTVEGVIADHGDGLTVPWQGGVAVRVDPTVNGQGPLVAGGTGQGWVVELHRPEADTVQLSPVLTSKARMQRAVDELVTAKRLGLIPAGVPLSLPVDLPPDVARRLLERWNGD